MPGERHRRGEARPVVLRLGAGVLGLLLLGGACSGAMVTATAVPTAVVVSGDEVTVPETAAQALAPAGPHAVQVEAALFRPTTTALGPDGQVLREERGPLREGDRGARTYEVQVALGQLGFDPGEADGTFDRETTMAVWAFQALSGLPKDGVVSEAVEARILAGAPIRMLRPDLGPTHTEVDLTRQVLLVWRDGELTLATHVSTGAEVPYCENGACGDAVTPEGEFRYEYRIAGERHAQLGVLYDPVYFDHDGHAVHGDPDVPDEPASHGCVRIPMHISPRFPSLVADGEVIALFRS